MSEETAFEPGDWEAALEILGGDRRHGPDILSEPHQGPITVDGVYDLAEQSFNPDHSEPNGSSISFLAEYSGRRVLFAADAHATQLCESIRQFMAERGLSGSLPVDVMKMSHHGSARNNSHDLLRLIDCRRFLISTNGSRHHHPDPEAIARAITLSEGEVELYFNYRSEETELWDSQILRQAHGFQTIFPEDGPGLKVEI
jgi:hypothetical protein